MHTTFILYLAEEDQHKAEGVAQCVWSRIDQLEDSFNRFVTTSEIARLASLQPNQPTSISQPLMECLVLATNVYAATNGAFDITLGAQMDCWRAHGHNWHNVPPAEVATSRAGSGMQRLVLDTDHLRLAITPDALGGNLPLELDLGGIAKGYAIDTAREIIEDDWEIHSYMIHGGTSTVYAKGSLPTGEPWRIGIAGEWQSRVGFDAVALDGMAVSGSGIERKGEHIIGRKRRHKAAWSCSASAAVADALSTAYLLMDWSAIRTACDALSTVSAGAFLPIEQPVAFDRFRKPFRQTEVFRNFTRLPLNKQ